MCKQNVIWSFFRETVMVFLLFMLSAQTLKATTQELVVLGDLDMSQVSLSAGYKYVASQNFGFEGDIVSNLTRSKLILLENGVEIGPSHSYHSDIQNSGGGRYSHWGTNLYFSSSNNSNPITNGKRYQFGIYADVGSNMQGIINMSGVSKDAAGNYCYITSQPLGVNSDTSSKPRQSIVRLFENGIEIGPAHSAQNNIRDSGLGRFSHWTDSLLFSSADNSDPRTNGKVYTYGRRQELVVLGDLDMSQVSLSAGYNYVASQNFGFEGDIITNLTRSKLILLENGVEIGPSHSYHSDIQNSGGGRYSHWGTNLYFSSSNNSNPITNGKRYQFGIYADAGSNMQGIINMSGVSKETGNYCYITSQPLGVNSDTLSIPQQSIVRLFENGIEIGPAHSAHNDIRYSGSGRFSHWTDSLLFSSADNSDPRTNGKAYTYGRQELVVLGDLDMSQVSLSAGYNYVASQNFGFEGDIGTNLTRSKLILLENGVEIGPSHSYHSDIQNSGGGRYSHWGTNLYFSSSNNSNPITNGKKYQFGIYADVGANMQGIIKMSGVSKDAGNYCYVTSQMLGVNSDTLSIP